MPQRLEQSRQVKVTVHEVLPQTGLAYVADDERSWAITRSTPGAGLDRLQPGMAVHVTLMHVEGAEIVSAYATLEG